ncbi:MAG: disulfide bond formation protein B [Xanthobacteraceae bacterium]
MDQTTAINHGVLHGQRGGPVAQAALAIFAISLATLLGAWFFQFVLGYPPCPLCLQQRIPYYIVIPLALILALAARGGVSPRLVAAGLSVILIAVLCGAALGTYHAGVEWHFWAGPTDCSGPLGDLSSGGSLLDQLKSVHVVRCDQAAWRFLGISLAGYNVLISLGMAAIAAYGLAASRKQPA